MNSYVPPTPPDSTRKRPFMVRFDNVTPESSTVARPASDISEPSSPISNSPAFQGNEEWDTMYDLDIGSPPKKRKTGSGEVTDTANAGTDTEDEVPDMGSEIADTGTNATDKANDMEAAEKGLIEPSVDNIHARQDLKKKRMKSNVLVKPPLDIAGLQPKPLQRDYRPHPSQDRNDAFYTEAFRRLFRQIENMVSTYFCVPHLDMGEFFEPWRDMDLSPEFITWADQVAEADTGGWNELLRDATHRKWLLMGIIMRIIQNKVFDADLFGANLQEKELLFGIERALLTREGFCRTEVRAKSCSNILGGNAVTVEFYPRVSELAAQVALLLQPLTTYLYGIAPPPDMRQPNLQDMYQSLHNIISTAAYLSLAIRCSPSIFQFRDIRPGTVYDQDDHRVLEAPVFIESKRKIVEAYAHAYLNPGTAHQLQAQALKTELEHHVNKPTSPECIAASTALVAHNNSIPPNPGYTHRPKTKIAVWPVITRYKPGSADDDHTFRALREKDGFRIHQIAKGAAVMYFGVTVEYKRHLMDEAERLGVPSEFRQRNTLRRWLGEERVGETEAGSRGDKARMVSGAVVLMAVAAAGAYGAPQPVSVLADMVSNCAVRFANTLGSLVGGF